MRLERSECKYRLTEEQAARVLRTLRPYLRRDPYAERSGGRYPISSLYLDSVDLALHRATVEGQRSRFKLRVRSYSDDAALPVHLEIKRREGSVIRKSRVAVARAGLRHQLAAAYPEFARRLDELRARPTVLVRYQREAYLGAFDRSCRVTFDRGIMAARARELEVRLGGCGWRMVQAPRVLLELKFTGPCPAWMARGVQQLDLRRQSYSKYTHAVLATQPQLAGGSA